jgi:hypothetical protein
MDLLLSAGGRMKTDEAFSTLVGRIYDCALDTFLWPEVLGAITHAVNGRMGDLAVVNPLTGTGQLAAAYNWPDDVRELAYTHSSISPAAPVAMTAPMMEPLCSSRDLDIEAFHDAECHTGVRLGHNEGRRATGVRGRRD